MQCTASSTASRSAQSDVMSVMIGVADELALLRPIVIFILDYITPLADLSSISGVLSVSS